MTLHYTPMGGGGGRKGPSQRVHHGQNEAFRVDHGPRTARDLEVERLKQSLHGENAHVPDCLTWNVEDVTDRNRDGYGSPRSPRKDYYARQTATGREFSITSYKPLPRHPELGRPKAHLYGDDGPPDVNWKVRPNDGGVADAMVGWPETRREEDRYGKSGMGWEVDLFGHGKGTARGNQMDSCRNDCNGKCQKRTGVDDHDRHNAKSVPNDRGCCDHRTCGCIPQIPERHPRHQVTYDDHSHLPQKQQPQQQQQQQRCQHCRGDDPSIKGAFHVM